MPVYEYKGMDSAGKPVRGIIDAENERAGRLKLRRSSIYPTSIVLEGARKGGALAKENDCRLNEGTGHREPTTRTMNLRMCD